MVHRMKVAGLWRDLPICPVNENLYIAGFVIFGDQELTVACARELLKKAPEYDYLITAEAKGIPLAHEMARQSGAPKYFLARKAPKLYMTGVFESSVKSITTEKEQKLYLDVADAELMKGKRILIVDDVISTGESPGNFGGKGRRYHCGPYGCAGRRRRPGQRGHHLPGKAPPVPPRRHHYGIKQKIFFSGIAPVCADRINWGFLWVQPLFVDTTAQIW